MIDSKRTRIYETKLQPPQMSTSLLAREKLSSRLADAGENGHVVTVVAPAGSGKSTLLTQHHQALTGLGFTTHWLSLDRTNDDPRNFALHLFKALGQSISDSGEKFLRFDASDDAQTLFQQLLDSIASRSDKVAIFFDDFHTISSPLVLDFLNALMGHLPSNIHLVFASRSSVGVDISRRKMSGTLLEITAADLNLDVQQLQKMLHCVHGIELSSNEARTLFETTEGWMAGTQLAALSIKSSPNQIEAVLASLSAQNTDLKDYLFSSVIEGLRPELRHFLVTTAPLTKMSTSLCKAISGIAHSDELIAELRSSNLFLIPLDHRGKWYRYHHLFAEFLQNELAKTEPERLNDIRSTAARWSEENGYLTDAIQYYLESDNHNAAAELINTHARRVALDNGDHLKILDWMRRLPKEFQNNNPELLLSQAWSRAFSRDAHTAKALCAKASDLLENPAVAQKYSDTELSHLKWYGQMVGTLSAAALEKVLTSLDETAILLEKIPENELALRASVLGTRACCMLVQKQFSSAASTGAQQYKLGKAGDVLYSTIWGLYFTGVCNIELGRLDAAGDAANQAALCVSNASGDKLYTQALAALLSLEVAVQRCNFSSAQDILAEHDILSIISAPVDLLIRAYKSEARQLAWSGSLSMARKSLHQAQEIGLKNNFQRLYVSMAAEEVALQLLFSDLPAAMDTLRRTDLLNAKVDSDNREVARPIKELQRITEARLMLAENKNSEASKLLYKLLRVAEHCDHQRVALHIRALRSIAMWALGDQDKAIRELDKALSLAAPEGLLYPLASAGSGLLPVLNEISLRRKNVAERDAIQTNKREIETKLRSILTGNSDNTDADESAPPTPDSSESKIDLTSRELELIRLIAAGLNNKELADELFISVSTTKWHLQNIFGKLGVRNRTAAIATARKYQLI